MKRLRSCCRFLFTSLLLMGSHGDQSEAKLSKRASKVPPAENHSFHEFVNFEELILKLFYVQRHFSEFWILHRLRHFRSSNVLEKRSKKRRLLLLRKLHGVFVPLDEDLQRLRRADDRMVHKAEEELLESPAASFYELSIEPVEVWVDPRLVRKGRNEVAGVLLLQLDVQPDEVIEPSVNYDLTRRVLFQIRLTSHLVHHVGLISVAALGWLGHSHIEANA
mmetsp:Transcript_16165/g.36959  ORF Transcript_16165/g.36959 Transcript_16165/m.36959 type:complete len:221 (-) Transcript_16165:195-857(-)